LHCRRSTYSQHRRISVCETNGPAHSTRWDHFYTDGTYSFRIKVRQTTFANRLPSIPATGTDAEQWAVYTPTINIMRNYYYEEINSINNKQQINQVSPNLSPNLTSLSSLTESDWFLSSSTSTICLFPDDLAAFVINYINNLPPLCLWSILRFSLV